MRARRARGLERWLPGLVALGALGVGACSMDRSRERTPGSAPTDAHGVAAPGDGGRGAPPAIPSRDAFRVPVADVARPSDAARSPCVVRRLSDGDSFECRDGRRVRLLLVDAPELAQRGLGDAAKAHLATLLPRGDTAWLEFDVTPQDPHGRWLAYAWRGDTLVNERLAADGYAVLLRYENVRHLARIERAEAAARRARHGLWAEEAFSCRPVDFRAGRCRE